MKLLLVVAFVLVAAQGGVRADDNLISTVQILQQAIEVAVDKARIWAENEIAESSTQIDTQHKSFSTSLEHDLEQSYSKLIQEIVKIKVGAAVGGHDITECSVSNQYQLADLQSTVKSRADQCLFLANQRASMNIFGAQARIQDVVDGVNGIPDELAACVGCEESDECLRDLVKSLAGNVKLLPQEITDEASKAGLVAQTQRDTLQMCYRQGLEQLNEQGKTIVNTIARCVSNEICKL